MPPFVRSLRRPRPLFHAHAGRCPARLQVGGVDHHSLFFAAVGSQTCHHLGEDAFVAPPLPTIVQRLMPTIGGGGIPPPKAVAIDEDNSTQYTSIIDALIAVGLREEGSSRAIFSSVSQKRSDMFTAQFSGRDSRN